MRKTTQLSRSGVSPTTELAKFLVNVKQTKGFDRLMDTIYNGAGTVNEFDQYGHFARTVVAIGDCSEYVLKGRSGCNANFTGSGAAESSSVFDLNAFYQRLLEEQAEESGGTAAGSAAPAGPSVSEAAPPVAPGLGEGEGLGDSEGEGEGETPEATAQRALLDYFLRR